MNKNVVMLSLLFVMTVLFFGKAVACSCRLTPKDVFDKEAFIHSPVVVTAEVTKHLDSDKVLLRIVDVWKGKSPTKKEAKFSAGHDSMCSPTAYRQPDIGTKYLLYMGISMKDKPWIVGSACGRSDLLERRSADLEGVQEYRKQHLELDKTIAESGNSREAKVAKAEFLMSYNDYLQAYDLYKELVSRYPDDVLILSSYAELVYEIAENRQFIGNYHDKKIYEESKKKHYEDSLMFAEKVLVLDGDNKIAKDLKVTTSLHLGKPVNSDFEGLTIADTYFKYEVFKDKIIKDTSFKKSRFYATLFDNVTINHSMFQGARIGLSKFYQTKILNSNFEKADITLGNRKALKKPLSYDDEIIEESEIENSVFSYARIMLPIVKSKIKDSEFKSTRFRAKAVVMKDVEVENSDFFRAEFGGTSSAYGNIENTTFSNSNFEEAKIMVKLVNSDFSQSNLKNVSLAGSSFDCKTKWPEGFNPVEHGAVPMEEKCGDTVFSALNFEEQNLEHVRFRQLNLKNADFSWANLQLAHFDGSNLENADFTGVKLDSIDFRNCNLKGAKFSSDRLYGINFRGADLRGVDLSNKRLQKITFDNADLRGADLSGSVISSWMNVKGAIYDSKTKWPDFYDPAPYGAILKE